MTDKAAQIAVAGLKALLEASFETSTQVRDQEIRGPEQLVRAVKFKVLETHHAYRVVAIKILEAMEEAE